MAEEANWPDYVKPLDVDGVGAVAVGTVLWLVALVVLIIMRDRLAESGSEWWIWVAVTGAALGAPGLWYTMRRRAVYRRAQAADDAAADAESAGDEQ